MSTIDVCLSHITEICVHAAMLKIWQRQLC